MAELRDLIGQHFEYTASPVAEQILDRWPEVISEFVKVMPTDYKRVLQERRRHDEEMESAVSDEGTETLRVIEL
jgi:glutamate synthase domain-containing protein 3